MKSPRILILSLALAASTLVHAAISPEMEATIKTLEQQIAAVRALANTGASVDPAALTEISTKLNALTTIGTKIDQLREIAQFNASRVTEVTNLRVAVNSTKTTCVLQWDYYGPEDAVSGFNLEWSTDNGLNWAHQAATPSGYGREWTFTNLDPAKRYHFRVIAFALFMAKQSVPSNSVTYLPDNFPAP